MQHQAEEQDLSPTSPQRIRADLDQFKRKPLQEPETNLERIKYWMIPLMIMLGSSLVFYLVHGLLDYQATGRGSLLNDLLGTTPSSINDAINSFIELLAAILGIVITVVAIVLQLAAQRYGTKLIDLFLEDKVNRTYFFLLVCSLLYAIFVVFASKEEFFPYYATETLLFLTVVVIAVLAPYFLYVFRFLTPTNLLSAIQESNKQLLLKTSKSFNQDAIIRSQKDAAVALEQVTDTALSANSQMDRNLGLMAINQIREMVLDYLQVKNNLPDSWFDVSNEHFIGISSEFYNEICEKKLWFEAKAFMDYQLVYKNCIRDMPDAVSAIAFNTRILGEEAIRTHDDHLLDLVIQFYNTFLRASINEKNVRAIFNLLYQYRLLCEKVFPYSPNFSAKILFYFKYYGEECLRLGLPFVMFIAAFDLGGLVASAYHLKATNVRDLLEIFMQLEDKVNPEKDRLAFDAIRKSQIILASYFYSVGEKTLVQDVIKDLGNETVEQLVKWRDALLAVTDKKFWEVTDRGINFEYIDDLQKEALKKMYVEFILAKPHLFKQAEKA